MPLFNIGDFLLHSGKYSHLKIDCDALTNEDILAIAQVVLAIMPPYRCVEGVPNGGLRLAAALEPWSTGSDYDPLLICDDVFTTGASMEEHRAGRNAVGVVIFSRQALINVPMWIFPLFSPPTEIR